MPATDMQGLPYPSGDLAADIPADLLALAQAIEKQIVQVYATVAARTAANPSPTNGQLCFVTADNAYYVRSSGAWKILWQDTGWVAITPNSGYTAGNSLAARRIGAVVYLRGSLTRTAGGFTNATSEQIFTLPDGYRPSLFLRLPTSGYPSASAIAQIGVTVGASGIAEAFRSGGPSGSTGDTFYLTGISFPIG